MLFLTLVCTLISSGISSSSIRGLEVLAQACEIAADKTAACAAKRMRSNDNTTIPVVHLSDSPINYPWSKQVYRNDCPLTRHKCYNPSHTLPMGESVLSFSQSTLFFESRIPLDIRIEILRRYSNFANRPSADAELRCFVPTMRELNFRDSGIVRAYLQYLFSFIYMNQEVHTELMRVNRLRIETDAALIAERFRLDELTTERVYEWYRLFFYNNEKVRPSALPLREDIHGNSLVAIAPTVWSARFIRPRLERLLANNTEMYPL